MPNGRPLGIYYPMTTPKIPLPFATDTNFAAGANPWSSTPVRVEPTSGVAAGGAVPGQRPSAQNFNYQVGTINDWVRHLSAVQPLNWKLEVGAGFCNGAGENVLALHWYEEQQCLLALGEQDEIVFAPNFDPYDAVTSTLPLADWWWFTAATNGAIVVAGGRDMSSPTGTQLLRSADRGATWGAAIALTATPEGHCHRLAYNPVAGLFVALTIEDSGTTTDVWTSPDGLTWTHRTDIPSTTLDLSTSYPYTKIAVSTGGVMCVGTKDGNHVAYSTDGGITWLPSTTTFPDGVLGMAYSSGRNLFMTFSRTDNTAWTSPDGNLWTQRGAGVAGCGKGLATDGGYLWVATAPAGSAFSGTLGGIIYSTDDGVTWTAAKRLDVRTGNEPVDVVFGGGRFWLAIDSGASARSGYVLSSVRL